MILAFSCNKTRKEKCGQMPIYPNRAVNKSKYCAFTEGKEITSNSWYKGKNNSVNFIEW